MSIGKQIAAHRKQLNITQDMLAQQLDVTCDCVDGDGGSASAGGSIYCDEINSDNSQQSAVHIHQQTSPSNQKRNAFSFIF